MFKMRALEKKYSHQKFYFFNVSQKVLLFEKSNRYFYKSIYLNAESKFFLLKRLEKRRRTFFTKPLLCVFLRYLNNYKTFFFSTKKQLYLGKKKLYQKHNLSKTIRKKKALFIGCVLKKVKGGFIVDIRGFLCFLPHSLTKSVSEHYSYKFPVRFFGFSSLSLQHSKNKGLYLSIILSSKSNKRLIFFLKKAISYNTDLFFKSF